MIWYKLDHRMNKTDFQWECFCRISNILRWFDNAIEKFYNTDFEERERMRRANKATCYSMIKLSKDYGERLNEFKI